MHSRKREPIHAVSVQSRMITRLQEETAKLDNAHLCQEVLKFSCDSPRRAILSAWQTIQDIESGNMSAILDKITL